MIIHLEILLSLCLLSVNQVIANVDIDIAGNDFSKPEVDFVAPDKETAAENGLTEEETPPKPDEIVANKDEKRAPKGNCKVNLGPKTRSNVIVQTPQVRMIKSNKEESKEVVKETKLDQTDCGTEINDLEPKRSEKIETYTETYTVTQIKHRTLTKKRNFIQRRRQVKQNINKPVLIVRRRVIKERQTFERIIPKIIETREVVNHPETKTKIIMGPIEEIGTDSPPTEPGIDVFETATECTDGQPVGQMAAGDQVVAQEVALEVTSQKKDVSEVEVPQQVEVQDGGQQVAAVNSRQDGVLVNVGQQRTDASASEAQANAAAETPVKFRRLGTRSLNQPNYDQSSYGSLVEQGYQPQYQTQQQAYAQQLYGFQAGYPQPIFGYPSYNPYGSYGTFGLYGAFGKRKK